MKYIFLLSKALASLENLEKSENLENSTFFKNLYSFLNFLSVGVGVKHIV